jgi:hypothetical protein
LRARISGVTKSPAISLLIREPPSATLARDQECD